MLLLYPLTPLRLYILAFEVKVHFEKFFVAGSDQEQRLNSFDDKTLMLKSTNESRREYNDQLNQAT